MFHLIQLIFILIYLVNKHLSGVYLQKSTHKSNVFLVCTCNLSSALHSSNIVFIISSARTSGGRVGAGAYHNNRESVQDPTTPLATFLHFSIAYSAPCHTFFIESIFFRQILVWNVIRFVIKRCKVSDLKFLPDEDLHLT